MVLSISYVLIILNNYVIPVLKEAGIYKIYTSLRKVN